MSIIKILARTGVALVCSVIQVFVVLIEGVVKLLGKLGEYLDILRDKMMYRLENPKKKDKETEESPA